MATRALSHDECVKLVRSPERYRPALLSVDGREPVTLRCFVLDNGDFLVPGDRALVRAAAGRTVTVTVTHRGLPALAGWTVTGLGLARPLVAADRPDPLPRISGGTVDFAVGVRVVIARLTGELTPVPERSEPRQ
ncbi:hypothetical protein FHX82_006378 [Amycolatopsis bartoniae]|uniref:Uncharacterized protein n=1 Tax=Amycolatopsis bartoniae TaxID=941986 RepID=A0A8H9IN66_9PSEU|nr:hypothetical protein [Amycolatopsis bartoniae]MBB2939292.1 hypothetical protein [Amycolatopsis bartoniae]TVT08747.1 hypothetical protein FNH07_11530 [Amycolatopsis bartoniae]GHF37531.1 hypothetical protein GCM10017566_08390 [Amycolatopsis bartoniae]